MIDAFKFKAYYRAALLLIALVLIVLVWRLQPDRIGDLLFKAAFLTGVGVGAFFADMLFVPYGRPHLWINWSTEGKATIPAGFEQLFIKACERRNHFVIGCMIAAALVF